MADASMIASRRSFLTKVACLSASAAGGAWLPAGAVQAALHRAERSGNPRIKISMNAYSFSKLLNDSAKGRESEMSLMKLIDFCARYDFDGLDATGYFFPGYPAVPDDKYVNAFKRRAFDSGVDISGTGVRNSQTTADRAVRAASVEHIKQWVEVAARLGAPVVRVFADTQMKSRTWQTVAPGSSRDEVERWMADDFRACAEHGEKFGVIIGVQNHGDFLKTSAEHLSLINRIDSPWCGPIVDTGYYKTDDPYQDIAAVAPYAVNWQVKESPIGAGSDVRTDLVKLLTIVRQSGYRGYLPIETLSASGQTYDPFVAVPRFLADLRQAVEATAAVTPLAENALLPTEQPARSAQGAPTDQQSTKPARKPPNKNKRNVTATR
ncbi:MAG TPA: sugar phosphate isomerase/epimerase family protein [Pirellulales bacterium]|jgi:sugar phosphate isomerase/epimerase|nr:sugar phosphate isomerase/epimerase family protein [Pirellulales bacterium]